MKTTHLVLCIVMILTLTGCEEFLTAFIGGGQTQPIDEYPLQLGNTWGYTRKIQSYNFRPLVPGAIDPRINQTLDYTVEVTGERRFARQPSVQGDSITVSELKHIEQQGMPGLPPTYSFLKQESDGLYMHGYAGSTLASPRPPQGGTARFLFAGHRFASFDELVEFVTEPFAGDRLDTLIREYPPLKSIKYPLRDGDQWTFRPTGRPWRIDKQTGPMLRTTVLGQSVRYHEVRWLYDMFNHGSWDDFISIIDRISNRGLVRRTLDFRDIIVSDEGHPEGFAKVDMRDEFVVTMLNVR